MSNTREDSNSGQRSVARQKAHKGNFRHKANENTVWTLVIIVLFYNSAFISANNPQKYPGKKIPKNSALLQVATLLTSEWCRVLVILYYDRYKQK